MLRKVQSRGKYAKNEWTLRGMGGKRSGVDKALEQISHHKKESPSETFKVSVGWLANPRPSPVCSTCVCWRATCRAFRPRTSSSRSGSFTRWKSSYRSLYCSRYFCCILTRARSSLESPTSSSNITCPGENDSEPPVRLRKCLASRASLQIGGHTIEEKPHTQHA